MRLKKHNQGCCCLKTYVPGVTHECTCGCIGITGTYNPDELLRLARLPGLVMGKPIEIKPDETSKVSRIPALYRPEFEGLIETFEIRGDGACMFEVAHVYKAALGQKEVVIGGVKVQLMDLAALSTGSSDDAQAKLGRLVGQAVAQAWVDLVNSGENEAARSMEIGS